MRILASLGTELRQRLKFSWHIGCETIYQDESDSVGHRAGRKARDDEGKHSDDALAPMRRFSSNTLTPYGVASTWNLKRHCWSRFSRTLFTLTENTGRRETEWEKSDSAKLRSGSWGVATTGFSHLITSVSC